LDLVYFIILVSVLVFVHELGHFAVAKAFGVKVITFSLGFGPKIVRVRGKETEYCIGLLPFGGFVKMLEKTDSTEPILPEDEKRTFEAQAAWKRVLIVIAGPAMNVLFPVLLYTSVYFEDRELLPPTVGVVLPGHPADGRLLPGDRILAVDGEEVSNFTGVQRLVSKKAGTPVKFSVERDGKTVEISITPNDDTEVRELDIVEHTGRIGILPSFPASVIGVPRTDSPAYRAGLRTFDRVTAVNGRKVERYVDLVDALSQNRGDALVLAFLRPVAAPEAAGGLVDIAVLEPQVATLTPLPRGGDAKAELDSVARAADVFARTGIESSDLYVSFVPSGSSEWKAGLRAGDRITALDGVPKAKWHSIEEDLVREASRRRKLEWTRDGEPMGGSFELRNEQWNDEFGQHYERYVFRTTHFAPNAPDKMVPNDRRLRYSLSRGFAETGRAIEFVAVGFLRLLQGRVSLAAVSGPITLYDVAGRAGAKGTTYFVWAMALVSINLGIINLLPIPVLDGGHLAFLVVETVRRRPLTRRTREIASLIGMSMLVLLMAIAFKNDVSRHWTDIAASVHDMFSRGHS